MSSRLSRERSSPATSPKPYDIPPKPSMASRIINSEPPRDDQVIDGCTARARRVDLLGHFMVPISADMPPRPRPAPISPGQDPDRISRESAADTRADRLER